MPRKQRRTTKTRRIAPSSAAGAAILDGPYARRAAELVNAETDTAEQREAFADSRQRLVAWIADQGPKLIASMRDCLSGLDGPPLEAIGDTPYIYVYFYVKHSLMPAGIAPSSVCDAVLVHLTRALGGPHVVFEVRPCCEADAAEFDTGLQVCAIFAD